MSVDVWTLEAALASTKHMKRTLLLGSGFSAALDTRYLYESLYAEAEGLTSELRDIFDRLETRDFEEVIRALCHAELICQLYHNKVCFQKQIRDVKSALVHAIRKVHHPDQTEISDQQAQLCYRFFTNFDEIFTLNYDLLPYWVLMKNTPFKGFQDGFGYDEPGSRLLTARVHNANFYYLHGALHLYEDKAQKTTHKLTMKNHGERKSLMSQIQDHLSRNHFPLFVSEGEYADKLKVIYDNDYLREGLQKLTITGRGQSTALFSYGVSFNKADRHILKALKESGCEIFFIGVYKTEAEDREYALYAQVTNFLNRSFNLKFYNSSRFSPWRDLCPVDDEWDPSSLEPPPIF